LRVVFIASEDLVIEDTWYVSGLQATCRHHVRAATTPIELERSCSFSDQAWAQWALWRMPMFTVLGSALVAAPLGIARGALDVVFDTISSATTGAMRATSPMIQWASPNLAAADASLRAAHAGVVAAVDDVWILADTGERAPRSVQARVLLAIHCAIDSCVDAMLVAHRLCGGAASYSGDRLLTALHDVHAARQHILFAHQHRALFCRIAAGIDEKAPPFVI
jgi:hypothetical protein